MKFIRCISNFGGEHGMVSTTILLTNAMGTKAVLTTSDHKNNHFVSNIEKLTSFCL